MILNDLKLLNVREKLPFKVRQAYELFDLSAKNCAELTKKES